MAKVGGGNPIPFEIGGGSSSSELAYRVLRDSVGIGGSAVEGTIEAAWRWSRARGLRAAFSDSRAALCYFPDLTADAIKTYEDILLIAPAPEATDEERRRNIVDKWVGSIDVSTESLESALQRIDPLFSILENDEATATTTQHGRAFEDWNPFYIIGEHEIDYAALAALTLELEIDGASRTILFEPAPGSNSDVIDSINNAGVLSLDVAPATDWAAGDKIEQIDPAVPGTYCYAVAKIDATHYCVRGMINTFTLGSKIGVSGSAPKQAEQGAAFPTHALLSAALTASLFSFKRLKLIGNGTVVEITGGTGLDALGLAAGMIATPEACGPAFGSGRNATSIPNYSSEYNCIVKFELPAGAIAPPTRRIIERAKELLVEWLPAWMNFMFTRTTAGFILDRDLLDLGGLGT